MNETGFLVQRAINSAGPWTNITTVATTTPNTTGAMVSYTDTTAVNPNAYYYRVMAVNLVGYTGGGGVYPTTTAYSAAALASPSPVTLLP